MKKKVGVIGAGVGGLSVAARLACSGYGVSVFEKLPRCGGRANIIEDRGFRFDTGPSFVMMPDFFKEIFESLGLRIDDYLDLKILDVSYKIIYADGQTFTVYRDSSRTEQELEKIEKNSSVRFKEFIDQTAKFYYKAKPFLYKSFTPRDLLDPRLLPLAYHLKVGQTYWQLACRFFKSEKLRYAFTFEAMFMGVSPYRTPAFYSIISYADHIQKIYHPMGGMYEIPKALEKLAEFFGAKLNYNCQVESVAPSGKGYALETSAGSSECDVLVFNADYSYSRNHLLKKVLPDYEYSCSVFLLYWGLKEKVIGPEHHNLFLCSDLKANLEDIFSDRIDENNFSFYLHVPTVTDRSLAPENKDIFYILIPTCNLNKFKGDFSRFEDKLKQAVLKRLNKFYGRNFQELIEVEHRFYPRDFVDRYNIMHGATFGLSHTFRQSAFFRPANFDRDNKNLYYVGASTQPGGGLPPVIASSKIVADLISEKTA
ncbi:MAG: phytoene desaturase [Candidatus Omnitrophica bacterium]|nr:phytoene desaturase [Candidatus Omnitrophota bacterium]